MNTPQHTLEIKLGAARYAIHIGAGLLDSTPLWASYLRQRRALLVTNETVHGLVAARLLASLGQPDLPTLILPDGEATKTLTTLSTVYDALAAAKVARDGLIIAVGGGVIGDVAGFAAATWQRGIDVLQVPTTLLAQVDSSVGGKTAVNHPKGKNLIGAFHQPIGVISDVNVLHSLPARELSAGLAEVIKYALIDNGDFWPWLQTHMEALVARDAVALSEAIRRSCEIKAQVVGLDEREQGVRAFLNFGHTFGHAIETGTHYKTWLHGEAVALGMLLATRYSESVGLLTAGVAHELSVLLKRAQLPTDIPKLGGTQMLEWMGLDKKVQKAQIRLVLLQAIGKPVLTDAYSGESLQRFLTAQCSAG